MANLKWLNLQLFGGEGADGGEGGASPVDNSVRRLQDGRSLIGVASTIILRKPNNIPTASNDIGLSIATSSLLLKYSRRLIHL